MTPRERYLAVLQGRPADCLPRLPIVMRYAAEYIGSNYGALASDHRVLVEANRACARDFGFDQLSVISDPYRETQGFGAEVRYTRDDVPHLAHHPLEESRDLGLLAKPDPYTTPRMLDRLLAIRAYRRQDGDRYSILGWVEGPAAEAADLRRPENFFTDLLDDEEYAGRLMDLCLETGLAFAAAQLAEGADTIGIGDAVVSQVSAGVYERLIFPRQARLCAGIRAAGGQVRLHICGNITHLLPVIARLPIDILDLDWMVDVEAVCQTIPRRIALTGLIDPVAVLLRGHPAMIRAQVEALYQRLGNPWMVAAGCEIPSGTPAENVRALCQPFAWQPLECRV